MLNQKTVLVVEDDPMIARVICIRLHENGYETITANDGSSGVSEATRRRPDAIVMDMRMPGKNGVEAIMELKQQDVTKEIPVVMLSASLMARSAALDAGARFFVSKPYEHQVLLDAVNTALVEREKVPA